MYLEDTGIKVMLMRQEDGVFYVLWYKLAALVRHGLKRPRWNHRGDGEVGMCKRLVDPRRSER